MEENLPNGQISAEDIEQFSDRSLIDILKEVPYANSVIDQNKDFNPKKYSLSYLRRALFFLREELLINALKPDNIVELMK